MLRGETTCRAWNKNVGSNDKKKNKTNTSRFPIRTFIIRNNIVFRNNDDNNDNNFATQEES